MADRRFKAIVLDLFGTLVEWNGSTFSSTVPLLIPTLKAALGERFELDPFMRAYNSVLDEIAHQRAHDEVEVTCNERFARVLRRLGMKQAAEIESLAEALTRTHMEAVRGATSIPPGHKELVELLALRYRLGLLSNFDEARTGRRIVADTGVATLFEAVVISAEVGIRKPNPKIFALILERLGLPPDRILFVGDTLYDDVLGAKRAGIPVVWLRRGREEKFDGTAVPDFVVEELVELPQLLEVIDG